MITISAVIITKNEENNITKCIESLLWVDEIIVVDSGSTDKTKQICQLYSPKVKFHETDWPGFGKQKNRALKLATSDWILSIDADEMVTPELKLEIVNKIQQENNKYIAYKIPRLTYFLNQPIKYCFGDTKDSPVRLVKRGFGSFSDDIVHERLVAQGTVEKLSNKLQHYSFDSIESMLNKMNSYSTLGAIKLREKNKKTSYFNAIIHAIWIFIKIYVFRLGFLDGKAGFLIATLNAQGTFYKYAKLFELSSYNK